MTTTLETITPEQASCILAHNPNNRPLRMREVDALCRDMKAGTFISTHQGIAFDENGNLLDGQHRLTACALSGVPITVLVTRGMPRDAMDVVDTGIKRSYCDRAVIVGKHDDEPICDLQARLLL